MSPNNNTPTKTAAQGSAAVLTTQLPTVAGAVPPALAGQFQTGPLPQAEFCRLPRPRERCTVSGMARSTLIELDADQPPVRKFIVKLRRRGLARGTVLVSVPRLLAVLREAAAEQLDATSGKESSADGIR
jgi:hypothetical protein